MSDHSELKKLAVYCTGLNGAAWYAEGSKALESIPCFSAEAFIAAATPAAVLALIAENEALRKLAPSKEIIWCACGDGHAANSYGAGFMDANNGVCANCDAAMGKGEQS
ncbi:hypothetical protein [Pseudomonas sp. Y24-6]|uniref:hypothetical protein n=1 Tax=Pseudomonas sp. Y24-6 TaxID=2750013 RepID=UPI001CE19C59|nr:hypothetical protein [Pseudomonas sp. Y24-6]MCA4961023.1 hypothetical protein [Pseudomonas sp. Y24-6]